MITNIEVRGFKRFLRQSFDMAPITLLTGVNGSGKTSLIQSFLLLREASIAANTRVLRLNHTSALELGSADGVRNWKWQSALDFVVSIRDQPLHRWELAVPFEKALYLDIIASPSTPASPFSAEPRVFTYLSADRLGPRNLHGNLDLPDDQLEIGERGQYAAHILVKLGNKPLQHADRAHPTGEAGAPVFLKYEAERWLSEITQPISVEVEDSNPLVSSIKFKLAKSHEWVSAPNMGYGVSCALPIVLGGLIAAPGGVLVVENPEAHLHPGGQSRIGVFLAWLAGRGVQVIVETHSDHVVNGVRRAIGEYGYISHSDATVHFFSAGPDDVAVVETLAFSKEGGISSWPTGFFDQYQIDVASLGRIRRQR